MWQAFTVGTEPGHALQCPVCQNNSAVSNTVSVRFHFTYCTAVKSISKGQWGPILNGEIVFFFSRWVNLQWGGLPCPKNLRSFVTVMSHFESLGVVFSQSFKMSVHHVYTRTKTVTNTKTMSCEPGLNLIQISSAQSHVSVTFIETRLHQNHRGSYRLFIYSWSFQTFWTCELIWLQNTL